MFRWETFDSFSRQAAERWQNPYDGLRQPRTPA